MNAPHELHRPSEREARPPGHENEVRPRPLAFAESGAAAGRLRGQVAIVTGGDSGIGRAVAVAFAREGADVAIAYLDEHEAVQAAAAAIEACGRRCIAIAGDLAEEDVSRGVVAQTVNQLGRIDVLVNHAAEQHPQDDPAAISAEQLQRTFAANVYAMFYCVGAALPHLKRGSRIVNTTSVIAYRGSASLLDYSASKGAIVAYTRSLALALAGRGIRVNAVAPGPVWTPLAAATLPADPAFDPAAGLGADVPLARAGEPDEIARCYVFLASDDSAYMTGQVLHPNGGEIING